MKRDDLPALLRRVRRGELSPARAAKLIAAAPLERLAFATLDHQRALRVGFPEVVFGQGKTPEQIVTIVGRLFAHGRARASTTAPGWWCCAAARPSARAAGCWWCAPAPPTCRWPRRR